MSITLNTCIYICTFEYRLHLQDSWRRVGEGFCRNTAGTNPWSHETFCTSLLECKSKCADCAGIAWAEAPLNNHDGCQSAGLSRCNVYTGIGIATRTISPGQEYTCYARRQEAHVYFYQITVRHIIGICFCRSRAYMFTRLTVMCLLAYSHYYLVCHTASRG